MRSVSAGLLFSVAVLLAGCGGSGGGGDGGGGSGGGGDTPSGTTTFSGGTLAQLQALSSSLSFDTLVISGALTLPINTATTIRANNLTVTSSGSIGYTWTTCQWSPAPDLTLTVAQSATINGQINLDGRNGTSVTGGASCNQCTGAPGGNLTITANSLTVNSTLTNDGGGGASFRDSFGSSPCSSGSSGDLQLTALTSMNLSSASITNNTGVNFEGDRGSSGTALVRVQNGMLTMQNGTLSTTGALTLQASSTDIFGPITYGTLNDTIGGVGDTTGPTVTVLAPPANASLQFGGSVEVQVQASDIGTGFKEVRIQGLNYDQTHPATQFANGTLTVSIPVPDVASPATLTVTGRDNRGNTTTQTITGLQIQVPAETEPNDSIAGAVQTLAKNSPLQGTIQNGDTATTFPASLANMAPNGYSGQKTIEDFYKVICCDRIMDSSNFFILGRRLIVDVDFSADAALQPDIDVYLLNSSGTVIASAVADNVATGTYKESLVAGGVGSSTFGPADEGRTFYVAVQAWSVPTRTRYRIERQ